MEIRGAGEASGWGEFLVRDRSELREQAGKRSRMTGLWKRLREKSHERNSTREIIPIGGGK